MIQREGKGAADHIDATKHLVFKSKIWKDPVASLLYYVLLPQFVKLSSAVLVPVQHESSPFCPGCVNGRL